MRENPDGIDAELRQVLDRAADLQQGIIRNQSSTQVTKPLKALVMPIWPWQVAQAPSYTTDHVPPNR